MLFAEQSNDAITSLKLEPLGSTPAPSSLSYLDEGVVYLGSVLGDSQVSEFSTFLP